MKKILAAFLVLLLALLPMALAAPRSAFAVFGNGLTNTNTTACIQGVAFCGTIGAGAGSGIPQIPAGVETSEILEEFDLGSLNSFTGGGSGGNGKQPSGVDTKCPSSSGGGAGGNGFMNAILEQIDPRLVGVFAGMAGENGELDAGAIAGAIFGNGEISTQLEGFGISGERVMDIFSSGSGTGVFNTGSFNFENIGSIFQEDGISGAFSGILGGGSGSDALSGAVSGVAGGAIEGIAGDALGGVVGGIGGGKVPVADAAVKKATDAVKKATNEVRESQDEGNTNTEVIEAKTTELIEKECNRDPAIAMAARALAAESSASTIDAIFDSSSSPIQDFAAFDRDTYKAGLLMFVSDYDGPHKDSVKRYLETQIAAAEGGGPTTPPNCGTDGLSRLFQGGLRMFGGCDEIGSREAAKSRAMQAGSKAREAARDALTFDYRPKVAECVVDGVTYDDLDHCPTSPILTSASDIKALSQEAQKEGRELDRNADEPGELGRSGDTGLRNLIETVLGNFGGLRGLTERDRGASQSGTYLKRLQNEAENVSLDSASGSIKGNITGAIVLEGAFQNKLKSSVVALEKNAKAFEDIRACFASLTQQPQNLATPIAQAAENASTTANALLKKAKTNKDLITDSRDLVTELSELLSRLTSGEEAGITEIAEERFTFLSITGEIHTNAQYTAFSIEADAALLALSVSLTDANAQLAACEAYP